MVEVVGAGAGGGGSVNNQAGGAGGGAGSSHCQLSGLSDCRCHQAAMLVATTPLPPSLDSPSSSAAVALVVLLVVGQGPMEAPAVWEAPSSPRLGVTPDMATVGPVALTADLAALDTVAVFRLSAMVPTSGCSRIL